MHVRPKTLSSWFNILRENPDMLSRYGECFWESQLVSKERIVDYVFPEERSSVVYIFGGWYGILAQLIDDNHMTQQIYTIDIDSHCEEILTKYCPVKNIVPVTADMSEFKYVHHPDVVINTSTEHVDQKTYDKWWKNIPQDTFYILQGNNLTIPEHIRTATDINHFMEINHCKKPSVKEVIECPGPNGTFERYMIAGYK